MQNRYLEGLKHRCKSDVPVNDNSDWMNGFNVCLEKLTYLEQALTYIVFEVMASREFCENSNTIQYTGKDDADELAEKFKRDIPIGFARMAFNTAILAATKLHEITSGEGKPKHFRALMEELSMDSLDVIDQRLRSLDITRLKYLRDKIVAHIDPVPFQDIDQAVESVCPNRDLLAFLDLLEPREEESLLSTHGAIDELVTKIRAVPGYSSTLSNM